MKLSYLVPGLFIYSLSIANEPLTAVEQYRQQFQSELHYIYSQISEQPGALSLHGVHGSGEDSHHSVSATEIKAMNREEGLSTTENITDCHMQAMALYPEDLQQVAYQSVVQGDAIEAARLKFVAAIDHQKQSSEELKSTLNALEQTFVAQANQCVARALEGTSLSAHHTH